MTVGKQESRILEVVAHELRGPLGAIVMFSELLEDDVRDELRAHQRELLSNIRLSGELLLKLIDELLEAYAGRLRLSLQPVDLVSLVHECISLQRASADQHGIQLELRCDAQLPDVTLDQPKILRVISELLDDAIRFSSAGQTVELRLSVRGPNVEIAVRNAGPGISLEGTQELVTPFAKHGRAGIAGARTLGLGLVLAKRIVAAHKGRIRVKSQRGAGSTFFVLIPINMKRKAGSSMRG
jgi:signal transduction histidine kinase